MSTTPEAPSSALPAPASRRRRRALAALVGLLLSPLALYGVSRFYFRHVPWSVPEALRAPQAPPVGTQGGLWVRYLGVTGYEVTDGKTVVLLDPTLTRPSGNEMLGALEPDEAVVAQHVTRADFILVNHAHHDHALDVPLIARRTGATVYGSASTLNLCRSRGVAEGQLREATPGTRLTLGTFTVDVRPSRHTAILGIENPMAGVIPPDAGPLRFWEFGQDGCLVYRLEAGGATLWFHPTTTYDQGDLAGLSAATLILGVTGQPLRPERAREIFAEARPRRVLPTHFDNFLQPLSMGLALMPGLDLDAARASIDAASPGLPVWVLDFGQTVHLPPD